MGLPLDTVGEVVNWWVIGFVIYFAYGRTHSADDAGNGRK